MTLEPGWLNQQIERVRQEVLAWPAWMRREAGFEKESALTQEEYISYLQKENKTLREEVARLAKKSLYCELCDGDGFIGRDSEGTPMSCPRCTQ